MAVRARVAGERRDLLGDGLDALRIGQEILQQEHLQRADGVVEHRECGRHRERHSEEHQREQGGVVRAACSLQAALLVEAPEHRQAGSPRTLPGALLHSFYHTAMEILVLYYSVGGSVRRMADLIASGIGEYGRQFTGPHRSRVSTAIENGCDSRSGAPYVGLARPRECARLALGSPTRFGNMAGSAQAFPRRHLAPLAPRRPRREARVRLHLHR